MKIGYGETAESRTMIISPLEAQLFMDAINFYPEGGRKVFAEFAEMLRRETAQLVIDPSDELAPRRPVILLTPDNQTHADEIIYDFAGGHIKYDIEDDFAKGDVVIGQSEYRGMVARFKGLRFIIDQASSNFNAIQSRPSSVLDINHIPGYKIKRHLTPVPDL